MIIEGLKWFLHALKWAVNPYPELIGAGWGHAEASIWMGLLYLTYFIGLVMLLEMYREWRVKETN